MTSTDRKIVLGFLALSLVLRLSCLHLNRAEYTDGILQITAFEYGFTFWPPLYTALVKALSWIVGDLELAGKLISILSSTLLIIPLYWVAHRFAGRRAAIYTMLFYLTSAVAWRWSVRVMSDSLFALLFFWATVLLGSVVDSGQALRSPGTDARAGGAPWALAAGGVLAVLAGLTRYQGVLLGPLHLLAIVVFVRSAGKPGRTGRGLFASATLLPWAIVAVWMFLHRSGHSQQIGERAAGSLLPTLKLYGYLFESFLVLFPSFVTIPVFVLCAAGLWQFLSGERGRRLFGWVFLAFAVVILAMQSVFSSFQSRYLLPLIPFMMVFAGVAAACWEQRAGAWLPPVRAALVAVLVVAAGWTAAVLWLQRGVFGDIKDAALFCAQLPAETRLFSTETYKPNMPCVKMSYWAGRRVESLDPSARSAHLRERTGRIVDHPNDPSRLLYHDETVWDIPKSRPLEKGEVVCLHSAYGGRSPFPTLIPALRLHHQLDILRGQYDFEEVMRFQARIIPLLPDVMENPDTHQNPAAWFFRYTPQAFETRVLRILGPRSLQ